MDTPFLACVCGHPGSAHAIYRPPYTGSCTVRACPCRQFACPDCGEIYGVHTARCGHTPRVPWDAPARE